MKLISSYSVFVHPRSLTHLSFIKMLKIHFDLVVLLILGEGLKLCRSEVPVKMCMIGENKHCILENFHLNKTDIDFKMLVSPYSTVLEIKNSSIPKLGNGVCRSLAGDLINEPIHLEGLHLSKLGIEEVTQHAFQMCKKLNTLILRDNKIENLDGDSLRHNLELEKIDLSNNLIQKLHLKIFNNLLKLKELYLTGNHLKSFSADLIESCVSLEVLRLDSNDLFDLNVQKIFRHAPDLKTLAVNNNQMRCERVKVVIKICKERKVSIDYLYEGEAKDRIEPINFVESLICLNDISWATAHYIYIISRTMEEK